MLNFFYDSLETLKKVKKPTNSEVSHLTIIIFVVVIISALMFAFMDGAFGELYNMIYETLSGAFA
jgi:preprotein translocase SecE subunit